MAETAFVFPGQGSQQVGMLQDLQQEFPRVRSTFEEASEVLGYDLLKLVREGPAEQLGKTEFTQPALLSASVALWRVWCDEGGSRPFAVAGHSLGEYSALVAAGVLSFSDGVALVRKRGQFMQAAVPLGQGGMAAIMGLDDVLVAEVCAEESDGSQLVQPANYNAPGQLVIAGHRTALGRAVESLKSRGARRALMLEVSAPFHSQLMVPAAQRMRELLAAVEFKVPQMALVQNADGDIHQDPAAIRDNLVKQMSQAVLWTRCVRKLVAEGVTRTVECGPGKVLSGLNKRIDRALETVTINSTESLRSLLNTSS